MSVLKHDLVPVHQILSQKEKKDLLDKYNISKFQLPVIKIKDPALKKLKAKVDDIVRIKRKSVSGEYTYYRRVV